MQNAAAGVLLLVWISVQINAQSYPCDGSFYYVATDGRSGSTLHKVLIDPSDRSIRYEQLPLNNKDERHLTCLGYNVKDQHLYALDFNSYELVRIGAGGAMDNLGVPENLDTTFEYHSGEMTPDGRRLVVVARDPISRIDQRIYSIQVNDGPEYYAGFFSIVSDAPVSLGDLAVDPVVGTTYAYDLRQGQIVQTDRTGLTSTNHRPFESLGQDYGSLFFDRTGQMYGLGSPGRGGGTQNQLYAISKHDGSAEKVAELVGGIDTDGCSCPYTIRFSKIVTEEQVTECNRLQINYEVINHAGIGQVGLAIRDILPEGFEIVDFQIENPSNLIINEGVGGDVIDFERWTLVLGSNQFVLVVDIPEVSFTLNRGSQASLSRLPQALGGEVLSDNPHTTVASDSTFVTVVDLEDIQLEDYLVSSCDLDTIYLSLPVDGTYHWSTGEMDHRISVTEEGFYSVTIESRCASIVREIDLIKPSTMLGVDIGSDRLSDLGDEMSFSATVDGESEVMLWEWTSEPPGLLSCRNCLMPTMVAREDVHISVQITDSRGCIASDLVFVTVDQSRRLFAPNVFTPNSDGVNDRFVLKGNGGKIVTLHIFNRLGRQVFQSKNVEFGQLDHGWDGSQDGSVLPADVYIWVAQVEFPDRVVKQYSGEVLLVN